MARPRDSQRQRLYDWEDILERTLHGRTASHPCDLHYARSIVSMVCRHYKIDKARWPGVTDGRSRRRAGYGYSSNTVKLPKWTRDEWTVLHELAHFLVCYRWGLRKASHGREFVSIYMRLLELFAGVDRKLMAQHANNRGLVFDHIDTYRKVRGKTWQ